MANVKLEMCWLIGCMASKPLNAGGINHPWRGMHKSPRRRRRRTKEREKEEGE
jgi:hypothetical protein